MNIHAENTLNLRGYFNEWPSERKDRALLLADSLEPDSQFDPAKQMSVITTIASDERPETIAHYLRILQDEGSSMNVFLFVNSPEPFSLSYQNTVRSIVQQERHSLPHVSLSLCFREYEECVGMQTIRGEGTDTVVALYGDTTAAPVAFSSDVDIYCFSRHFFTRLGAHVQRTPTHLHNAIFLSITPAHCPQLALYSRYLEMKIKTVTSITEAATGFSLLHYSRHPQTAWQHDSVFHNTNAREGVALMLNFCEARGENYNWDQDRWRIVHTVYRHQDSRFEHFPRRIFTATPKSGRIHEFQTDGHDLARASSLAALTKHAQQYSEDDIATIIEKDIADTLRYMRGFDTTTQDIEGHVDHFMNAITSDRLLAKLANSVAEPDLLMA